MTDSGLWFVKGKVTTKDKKDRVWAAHHRKWSRLYDTKTTIEERHRKELDEIDAKLKAVVANQPYTPWVGHVSEGAVTKFVDDARREWKRRLEERK